MKRRSVPLANEHGLHARPAGQFVMAASRFGCDVQVGKGDTTVNGKSIMRLLTLDCRQGDEIMITTDGDDEVAAMEELVTLVASGLGEPHAPG